MADSTQRSLVQDLTGSNVTKLLLRFAFPLFVSNALQAVYNLVDMIVVGQFIGGAGMSAVSTGGDVLHLLTFVAMGFSSAGQVLISQDVGAQRMDSVKKVIGNMFSFLLIASLAISVICVVIRYSMLSWLNTPAEAFEYTMDYTVTCALGLVFIYGYNVVSAILRGMGDSKHPFIFIAIAAVLNMILDVLFVAVFDMAVFGAALATVIGQGVSFIVSLVFLYHRKESFGFDFKLSSFKMDKETLARLVKLGVPMAIQSAAVSLSKVVLMTWINAEGLLYSALAGLYNKVGMMAGIVSNSLTTAGASMVGQNLGAKKYENVPKIMWVILYSGGVLTVIASAAIFFFSEPFYALFTKDADVLANTAILIGPTIVNFFGSCTRSVAFALINGSGNTKLNLAVALIDGMIARVSIAAILGFALHMGSQGFWYGDAFAGFVPICIGMIFFLSGKWKKAREPREAK